MITEVPPVVEPELGQMPVTTGTGYNVTINPVPDTQAKTAVFPGIFLFPSVGNVPGNRHEDFFEIRVYVPSGIASKRFTVIPDTCCEGVGAY